MPINNVKHIIYGLIDPFTKLLRYIGYTSNPDQRYYNHHLLSKLSDGSHKNNWIKKIIANNQKAEMIVIAEYKTAEELPEAEKYWYAFFISHGADLTNDPNFIGSSASNKGKKLTEEHKKKLSDAHKGKIVSQETKDKMSKAHIGKKKAPFTDEHIKNLSESHKGQISPNKGKKLSEEHKRKLSESHKGKISPNKGKKFTDEHRRKLSEAHLKKEASNVK